MSLNTSLKLAAIIIGSTLAVLFGFWVYCKIRRWLYGPLPPREPTDLDLNRMTWDYPTIMGTSAAAFVVFGVALGVMLTPTIASNRPLRLTGIGVSLAGGLASFFVFRALFRRFQWPSSGEDRRDD
ncbi:MAG: hypothetical protein DHS20C14_09620 [Phycisphaeraceae bacterium]|nr:MAG: hypothetical protein DHS20C14_09620 [Phycisphaeraceae bacterium]